MKKILFLVAMICVAGSATFAQQDEKARKILDDMSKKYQELPAYKVNFINKMENRVENISEQYSGEITVKGEKFKLVLGDQEVYNNGETVWTYFKDVNEVNIDDFEEGEGELTPVTIYNAYKDGYKYRFVEEKKDGPRTLNVVELQPEHGTRQFDDLMKIKLEIDKTQNTLSYMEIYDKSGSVYSYKMSGFNPQSSLNDSVFEFNPSNHPGVEVVDLR